MLANLRGRILNFKIYGKIDFKMVQKVQSIIQSTRFYIPQLVTVSINSRGGSFVQAKTLSNIFHNYANQYGVPVYCFAEDVVSNSAVLLLTAGNKCFANKYTIFTDFGYTHHSLGLKHFAEHWNYEKKYITSGENKVKLNQYEDLKEQDVKWIKNFLYEKEFELKKEIVLRRQEQFNDLKVTKEVLDTELWNKVTVTSKSALDLGLIDDITTLDQLIHKRYHDAKIIDLMNSVILINNYFSRTQNEELSEDKMDSIGMLFYNDKIKDLA